MTIALKLGTRRSLLAWAQSSWAARELERLNPGIKVELVGIDTRGDKILDVSLQSVAGKEFFVAELDEALRAGHVDFTVHSMKDLSLDRPKSFVLGAIPKRENPRDVVLFGPGAISKIAAGKTLKIGTSSPRRQENIPAFLERALPRVGASSRTGTSPRVEFVEIRGNVNTRLSRVHEPKDSPKHLDGVVLAFAGLIRLWADQSGRPELSRLLTGVRWMVLPLRQCPAAPAQGALAIECRADDPRVRDVLSKLHHEPTAKDVASERQLLADWGGGCHQKFGATALRTELTGSLLFIRGKKPDGQFVEELRWSAPAPLAGAQAAWDGSEHRGSRAEEVGAPIERAPAVFAAHSRAVTDAWLKSVGESRVWTSGVPSWFRLAEQGVWVEGCAEGMGYEFLAPILGEGVLQLPAQKDWLVLTHETGARGWSGPRAVATYRLVSDSDAMSGDARASLSRARHVFWSSGSQFDELGGLAAAGAVHSCGPGKTAAHLREKGIEPRVFPSAEEWRAWTRNSAN